MNSSQVTTVLIRLLEGPGTIAPPLSLNIKGSGLALSNSEYILMTFLTYQEQKYLTGRIYSGKLTPTGTLKLLKHVERP